MARSPCQISSDTLSNIRGEERIQDRSINESVRGGSIELRHLEAKKPIYVSYKSDLPHLSSKFRQQIEKTDLNGYMRNMEKQYKQTDRNDYLYVANPPSSLSSFSPLYNINAYKSSPYLSPESSTSKVSNGTLHGRKGDFGSKEKLFINASRIPQTRMENGRIRKLSEVLKHKVDLGLQSNFDLYPRLQQLLRMVNDATNCRSDIQASRETKIDYPAHFKLIDSTRLEMYCKAFAKMDKSGDCEIAVGDIQLALQFVDSLHSVPQKYIDYIILALDLNSLSRITIKMFCFVCTILETMIEGGTLIHDAVNELNLMIIHEKLIWYKNMFYEAVDYDRNYINLETVKLELFAGGMDVNEEREITERITRNFDNMISFVDFLAHIPLFIVMHSKICSNTFEMKIS